MARRIAMREFFKVHYDPGPGLDGESCIICGTCADALLDGDPEMLAEFGEPIEWSSYFPRFDLLEEVYCDHCDCCMEEEYDDDTDDVSDISEVPPCGYRCGDEPHGCLECDENPRRACAHRPKFEVEFNYHECV
jgi:hypothetical protein